jgi:dynein heavy chain
VLNHADHLACSFDVPKLNYIFMKQCVENSPIVPIQSQWLDNMLMLVPEHLKEGEKSEELLGSLIDEVSMDYEKSMKRYLGK